MSLATGFRAGQRGGRGPPQRRHSGQSWPAAAGAQRPNRPRQPGRACEPRQTTAFGRLRIQSNHTTSRASGDRRPQASTGPPVVKPSSRAGSLALQYGLPTSRDSRPFSEFVLFLTGRSPLEMATPVPDAIGNYKVLEKIGQGGMGTLYRARDPRIGRDVAIKLLREGVDSVEMQERLLREARSAGGLKHGNIVTIFELGEHMGQPFIAMEYVQGETLAVFLRRRPVVPL